MPLISLLAGALVAIAATLVAFAGASASSEQPPGPIVDAIVQPVAQEKRVPALLVGVSEGGRRSYFTYMGDAEPPIAADTLIEIGSITKVFTAILFAEAVATGRMGPEGSIQAWMPKGMQVSPKTRRITPLDLVSYRSGMPRLPDDVPQGSVQARDIDHYTTERFLNWVVHWEPEGDLPAPYVYSNASIGLLALLVGQAMGHPWPDLMRSRIIGPLGLIDTTLQPGPDQAARLAHGHSEDGAAVPPWPLFAWSAASSLKSTGRDMLAFGEANLGQLGGKEAPVPPSLDRAMQLAQEPIYRPQGADFLQAMVWAVFPADAREGTPAIIVKSGNTDGFSTVLALAPTKTLAVFIVATRAKVDVQALAIDIASKLP